MRNLSNKSVVDFDQIQNYEQAAKDFAEGNYELEELLLSCFNKRIKTIACCSGHEDRRLRPYIAFSYSNENVPYIYALISRLKDHGFNFRYNKGSNGESFFSIEERQAFSFDKPSTLFRAVNDVINSFDQEKNYYGELPKDLQTFLEVIQKAEIDIFLKASRISGYFQMCYKKKTMDCYEYSIITSNKYYNKAAERGGFVKILEKGAFYSSLTLKVASREMAVSGLNKLNDSITIFSKNIDERTNSNPLNNSIDLQQVSIKRKR